MQPCLMNVIDVKKMFPHTPTPNIEANLPHVWGGLVWADIADRDMLLMSLATIRAETESFLPISEGKSKYNTAPDGPPFGLYDGRFGNSTPGDGERYKGRGFIQLTFRANYALLGEQIGIDLVGQPDMANLPHIAGKVLAQFLKNKENPIRLALGGGDFAKARKLVNGGSHGLDRFVDAIKIGQSILYAA